MIEKNKPQKGLIQLLTITEKQYNKMEYVVGDFKRDIIDTEESVVVL